MKVNVEGNRGRGRLKHRWLDTIENDVRAASTCVGDLEGREKVWEDTKRKAKEKKN